MHSIILLLDMGDIMACIQLYYSLIFADVKTIISNSILQLILSTSRNNPTINSTNALITEWKCVVQCDLNKYPFSMFTFQKIYHYRLLQ